MRKFLAVMAAAAVFAFASPALAANPFADVPAGHWAYDAVAQLAADGLVAGYPDGSFKGGKTASRYEMAALVARAVARADEIHAGKQDLELVKKLAAEFKDELDAMGAKVDGLDKRVGAIEKNIGAWSIGGTLVFDAQRSSDGHWSTGDNENEWRKEQMQLHLSKRIDENTTFYGELNMGADGGQSAAKGGRGDISESYWTNFYIDTKLPYDIDFRVGRFGVDFEADYGYTTDNDGVFGNFRLDGFQLVKGWGPVQLTAIVGRNRTNNGNISDELPADTGRYHYIADLKYEPNEKFFGGITGYWFDGDDEGDGITDANGGHPEVGDADVKVFAIYAAYNFTPNITLRGIFYKQDLGYDVNGGGIDGITRDDPEAWRAILELKQDLLKFASLWIEYNRQDNNFWGTATDRFAISGSAHASVGDNMPLNDETTDMWFIRLEREWSDKITTGLRFAYADYGTDGYDNVKEYGAYITYQYTDAIQFQLIYDHIDYGDSAFAAFDDEIETGKDDVIMFRTTVEF